jgi:intraflagellar transport protein 122
MNHYLLAKEMIPICMRCSATNPFLNNQGDCCVNCQHPFVRSFISFEHLNLVEFVLDTDLDEQQAIEILEKSGSRSAPTQFREEWTREGDSETLKLYNDDTEITQIGIKAARDPFTKAMMNIEVTPLVNNLISIEWERI